MTSRAEKLDASPAWVERILAAVKAAARTTNAARANELRVRAPRRAPRLELRVGRGPGSFVAAGAALAAMWAVLWAVFVLAVAAPAAELHARGGEASARVRLQDGGLASGGPAG
jgi:hypothetical protein